ncbi:single-strand DNA-binding protein [Thermotomaculum hydrothermale]|uniref:Single-stranded DNA-binding protein n=1 Tax=Thermotomaculum hydrothermale TaxID=981385 RepID=A0A7R6PYS1_9BACT|nr:single-stranded DNA-binding protein [Thermotomaculum hydrothermale]BBB33335.1 single-strand DNA-binding protein [Thermotomaculum hydrothermale]
MFNRVILIGRAGQDIDVRFTPGGTKVAKFSLATSRSYMDSQGNWQEKTEWHNIALWGRLADKGERVVKKGNLYFIEGSIEYSSWDDSSGNKRYKTEIRALTLIPLTPRSAEAMKSSMTAAAPVVEETSGAKEPEPIDDIKEELDKIEEPQDDFIDDIGDDDVPF